MTSLEDFLDKKSNVQHYHTEEADGTFVCQGNSIEELAKLTLEIKKINKAVVLHDKSIFIFDNGIVHKQ